MSLQDIYYIVSIIFMTIGIIVLAFIGYVLFVIKNNINNLQNTINEKVNAITKYTDDPATTAVLLGSKVASSTLKGVRKVLKR